MDKAARIERIKMTATWFNGASVAALAVGCFAPIVAVVTTQTRIPVSDLNLLVATWLFLSVGLHLGARMVLRRIEE